MHCQPLADPGYWMYAHLQKKRVCVWCAIEVEHSKSNAVCMWLKTNLFVPGSSRLKPWRLSPDKMFSNQTSPETIRDKSHSLLLSTPSFASPRLLLSTRLLSSPSFTPLSFCSHPFALTPPLRPFLFISTEILKINSCAFWSELLSVVFLFLW